VHPAAIVRADILHNILLEVPKNMMKWIEGFLGKHKRLVVFDEIWSSLSPYPGFTPPKKQYRQITMWSGTKMRGVGSVIFACFTPAMHREQDPGRLSAVAQSDLNLAIRAVRALSDFCLNAQYRSHTSETIKYMSEYLHDFHRYRHIFGEFRASKADHKKAKGASKDLGTSQARQSTISNYFQVTARQKANEACADRQERHDLIKEMLGQATLNYPKLHLLMHYTQEIVKFGSLPQYSTEITETLHKARKDAYRRSNKVDATSQILASYARESACKMLELNLCAWGKELNLGANINKLVVGLEKQRQDPKVKQGCPLFGRRQQPQSVFPQTQTILERILRISNLVKKFHEYMRLNRGTPGEKSMAETGKYRSEYCNSVGIPLPKFEEEGIEEHHVR